MNSHFQIHNPHTCLRVVLAGAAVVALTWQSAPLAAQAAPTTRVATTDQTVKPVYYGRRLEPQGRRVLHGAGQDAGEFRNYFQKLEGNQPMLYMTYVGMKHHPGKFFENLQKQLDEYPDTLLIPQIGLSMTSDGKPDRHYEHEVAAGKYDANLEAFSEGLKKLNRPVFVRIGYEFNGSWNGYQPDTFKAAWKHIVGNWRKHGLDEVAAVWCSNAGGSKNYMDFYPGDEWVDWWSVDVFSVANITGEFSRDFVTEARQRQFPVMIGESTPHKIGVLDGQADWDTWFVPYFQFIHQHENIKAFSYISWDWSKFKQWHDWGDARIGQNEVVLKHYQQEMRDPIYIHGATAPQTRRALGLSAQPTTESLLESATP